MLQKIAGLVLGRHLEPFEESNACERATSVVPKADFKMSAALAAVEWNQSPTVVFLPALLQ